MKGKIVLIQFPSDDLFSSKVRPAYCLTNQIGGYQHIIFALITSLNCRYFVRYSTFLKKYDHWFLIAARGGIRSSPSFWAGQNYRVNLLKLADRIKEKTKQTATYAKNRATVSDAFNQSSSLIKPQTSKIICIFNHSIRSFYLWNSSF